MRLIVCDEAWRRADCFSSTVIRDEGMEKRWTERERAREGGRTE